MAAAKPPGVPPKAPAAPIPARAPQAPRIPIAPPTPKVSVEEAARVAAAVPPSRPRPPSTPDDWEQTEVTKPHDVMLSRDDVRAIVENTTTGALMALRAGQDELRSRLSKVEERLATLERAQLTPIAPQTRSGPPPLPVLRAEPAPEPVPTPVAAPIAKPPPVMPVVPVPVPVVVPAAPVSTGDPFAAVQAAPQPRVERISVDLSPEEMQFDGAKRNRRITIGVMLFLLIAVGTFIGIAMTSQMRAGH